jgi:hypothetical protein
MIADTATIGDSLPDTSRRAASTAPSTPLAPAEIDVDGTALDVGVGVGGSGSVLTSGDGSIDGCADALASTGGSDDADGVDVDGVGVVAADPCIVGDDMGCGAGSAVTAGDGVDSTTEARKGWIADAYTPLNTSLFLPLGWFEHPLSVTRELRGSRNFTCRRRTVNV